MSRQNLLAYKTDWNSSQFYSHFKMQRALHKLGIKLDVATGHLFYSDHFKPLSISYDLIFIRHGETFGNCGQATANGKIDETLVAANIKDIEKRIYQGNVDTEINQLTPLGKQQAIDVSMKLEMDFLTQGFHPEVILVSPLSRAKETSLPFIKKNKLENICFIHPGITEMAFGDWENRRICDFLIDDSCHLFYRGQHALIKSMTHANETVENFCDVLLRSYRVLMDLEKNYAQKRIVMFSHSMFGAACGILLGKGKKFDDADYLAFDGKNKYGHYYAMPNAVPFILNRRD